MSEESQEMTFSFQLRGKPIEVAVGGEIELASEIVFESPSSRNLKEVAEVKQIFSRAIAEGQERILARDPGGSTEPEVQDKEELEAAREAVTTGELLGIVQVSTQSFPDLLEIGSKLLVSGVGKVSGKKFSSTMMQNVPVEEIERMVGEYCNFFVMRSILEEN